MLINLTEEQKQFAAHEREAFIQACPGSGKTLSVAARIKRIAKSIPLRKGLCIISFTNSAMEEIILKCRAEGVEEHLKHPGYIGTIDSFIWKFIVFPPGISGVNEKPYLYESWDSIGIEVRLRGKNHFSGPGVSLDKFDSETNQVRLESIGHQALRSDVAANKAKYESEARHYRLNLRNKGYLSAAESRIEALSRLKDDNWAYCLGRALAARFQEIIVDEAQDCNPLDLQILNWLRNHGLPVVIVADPDQAIYGFRYGDPAKLLKYAESYAKENCFGLTGNFRSSPAICKLASTLRTRLEPDIALGKYSGVPIPVNLIIYKNNNELRGIGYKFIELAKSLEMVEDTSIILAHSRRIAFQAAGVKYDANYGGNSRIAMVAKQLCAFWSASASSKTRESALRITEKLILKMMGLIEDNESPWHAAEKHKIDSRWLRRIAFDFIMRLPCACNDSDDAREAWISNLHNEVDRLGLKYAKGISPKKFFARPPDGAWSKHLQQSTIPNIRWATIHEAKGHEFRAVCVVIPPDRSGTNFTSKLFDAWENRVDEEAKRVIYVGVTRAQQLLVLAIPQKFHIRINNILKISNVPYVEA